jgi:hypothetical protein
VLLTSRARQTVVVFPLLLFGFGTGMTLVAVNGLLRQAGWGMVLGVGLFGGFVLFLAVGELAVVRLADHRLRLWGVLRRRELLAGACAFGVRLQTGSRSSRYIVFVTDGEASEDVGEWSTERGARRGIERLSETLYGTTVRSGSETAQRVVVQIEAAWKATVAKAQKAVDAYYQSPGWRIGKYLIVGLIVSYSIGMMLYQYFAGHL